MKEVVGKLIKLNKTVSTMESCTGGFIASSITDVEGASDVLKFSAVTYSNEYKIKMGVSKEIIDKYSVYSMEVARQMAYNIAVFSSSNYGIGITGKINRIDKNNLSGDDNLYINFGIIQYARGLRPLEFHNLQMTRIIGYIQRGR